MAEIKNHRLIINRKKNENEEPLFEKLNGDDFRNKMRERIMER